MIKMDRSELQNKAQIRSSDHPFVMNDEFGPSTLGNKEQQFALGTVPAVCKAVQFERNQS